MRMLSGAIAAPITVGFLIIVAGCGSVAATATSTPPTAAPTSSAAPTPSTTPALNAGSPSSVVPTPTASPSIAFPGIWDITSWQEYRAAQTAVQQGHQPWLLDPASVVRAWAASRWNPAPTPRRIAADTFQLTEPGTHLVDTIHGVRPDPTSAAPIWVITQITHS